MEGKSLVEWITLVKTVLSPGRLRAIALLLLVLPLVSGCATSKPSPGASRRFDFARDTFAYPNELLWVYHYDAAGKWTTEHREPKPEYAQHCFVVARSARQFFLNARFAPDQPVASEAVYRRLIRRVAGSSPRHALPDAKKIIIPGYPDLRTFSQACEELLKAECGGSWESYVQRGHWRMVFPFSRNHQAQMARQLLSDLERHEPLVVHVARFPQLTINHAMVIYEARETNGEIQFITYDPNRPAQPTTIMYDRGSKTFSLPPNEYFRGGRVDLYEVYGKWNY